MKEKWQEVLKTAHLLNTGKIQDNFSLTDLKMSLLKKVKTIS